MQGGLIPPGQTSADRLERVSIRSIDTCTSSSLFPFFKGEGGKRTRAFLQFYCEIEKDKEKEGGGGRYGPVFKFSFFFFFFLIFLSFAFHYFPQFVPNIKTNYVCPCLEP